MQQNKCAISLALLEKGYDYVSVDGWEARVTKIVKQYGKKVEYTFAALVGQKVANFIVKFDEDKKSVKPTKFSFDFKLEGAEVL